MKYNFFTSNEIKPSGWMKRQLEIQAEGLSGNLDKMWPDIKNSQWIGGDKEGWERVPYWLDGFIPLAYLLDNDDLKARAKKYIDAIIENQKEDGWICPCSDEEREKYDTWAVLLISKVLVVYADASNDERIEGVLEKALYNFYEHLKSYPLFNWGKFRWYEGLIAVYWLYERTHKEWLVELAKLLRDQRFSHDEFFSTDRVTTYERKWTFDTHVVNIAMALKGDALWSLFDKECDGSAVAHKMLNILDEYHGTAAGHFTGDECLAGNSPIQGTELCGVAEAMYSYEWLYAITGETYWLDRLEMLAYNAFPATVSPDMWTHQYDQMTNQVSSVRMWGTPIFGTNNGESHIFGLEPNFGCCTANFNQAFPKFVLSSFFRNGNDIVSASLIPTVLTTDIDGKKVTIELVTEYPFRNKLTYKVTADEPVSFRLLVRVPEYMKESVGNDYFVFDKVWSGSESVTLDLDFEIRYVSRPNNTVCLKYGPMIYSVAIDENKIIHEYERDGVVRKYPYCDYEIYPASEWNYAFTNDSKFDVVNNDMPAYPFSPEKPAVEIYADMVNVNWGSEEGYPDVCAKEPASRKAEGDTKKVRLIPYGCTNIRFTETVIAE